jgi:hypothetical protein
LGESLKDVLSWRRGMTYHIHLYLAVEDRIWIALSRSTRLVIDAIREEV